MGGVAALYCRVFALADDAGGMDEQLLVGRLSRTNSRARFACSAVIQQLYAVAHCRMILTCKLALHCRQT